MEFIKFICIAGLSFQVAKAAFGPKRLYSMDMPTQAVSVKVIGKDLLIVGPWYIGSVKRVDWKFRQPSRMKPRIVNKDIPNPRAVGRVPSNAFSGSKALTYWVASWGANETSGAMYVMRPTATYSVWKDIAIDAGWNYERAQWVDMNRDGRIDCLTARYRGGVGQLLWFQQPAGQDKWGQQIIHEGMADGNFIGFVKGGKTYILVAGLQFSTLGLYWTMSRANLWSTSRMVRHRVVDNYGKFYDVQYVDLNRDGRPDVLTTTVNIGNSRGHVLGYEVPNDIQNKIWKRRVLAAGFTGEYSPGKATAFWPNKWKRKTDRPSIFLSGAGQETLIILTPRPARSGWSYVKSPIRAGTGMIGLPYIGDIDGDSYPEVFVPQGNKLHVFSYDYNAAVANPPNNPTSSGKPKPRPVVKFVPPFFRPPQTTAEPLIPRDATPLGVPRAGGLTGDAALRFGASGVLPSSGGSGTVAPLGDLPPLRTRGGSSSGGNSRGSSSNLPANAPRYNPPSGGSSDSSGPASGGAGASATSGGGSSGGTNTGFGLWPVMTNNGPVFVPIPNQVSPIQGNSPQGASSQNAGSSHGSSLNQGGSQPSSNLPGNNRINAAPSGWNGASNSAGGGASTNDEIVPLGGGSSTNDRIVPLGGSSSADTSNQDTSDEIVPLSGSSGNNRITSNEIVPLGGSHTPNRPPMEPVFEDETDPPPYEDYYYPDYPDAYYNHDEPTVETPANLLLSITDKSYRYRQEAADACSFENKVLCNLMQLEAARGAGPIPLIEWGWFDMENRAAAMEDCVPGEVKWKGYKCHNGIVGHAPVQQTTALKGYCCSVLRGANVTDQKFSNYHGAEEGCSALGLHICSLEEMFDVWEKSSYKSDVWGWYKDDQKLIKMVHTCDPNLVRWRGYECLSRKLATSRIASYVQESAYCCHSSGSTLKLEFTVFLFSLFLYYYTIF